MKRNRCYEVRRRFAWFTCGALSLLPLAAQTNPPPDRSSRYLFIADTSAAMRRRAPAVETAVENLLRSSMAAQLKSGDTIGVWTFDEQLYAGRFPLQVWTPEHAALVTSNVMEFFKSQKYQKKSSLFETVVPALQRIVQDSRHLTILLVSDGNENISGTPFDSQIAGAFADKFKEQEKARMPFITVLRSMRGQIRNATVNLAPWPVDFPDFPPEPKNVEALRPKPPEPKPALRPVVPPLIVIGKKPEPPSTTNTIAIATAPPAAAPVAPLATTNAPTEVKPTPAPTPPASAPAVVAIAPPTNAAAAPTHQPAASVVPVAIAPKPYAPTLPSETNRPAILSPAQTPAVEPSPTTNAAVAATAPANPPAQVALAVESQSVWQRFGLLAVVSALLLLAMGVLLVMRHQARRATGSASLITRSMDRDHK